MKQQDLIQNLSFFGMKYVRILSRNITQAEAEELKKKYHYVHIYSFTKEELPGFDMITQQTPIFNLSDNLENIFRNFNDTCKKHIRRGERNPDLKLVSADTDFDASYAFYKKIKSKEGVYPELKREFVNCLFFNAYFKGKMIVTMSFYDNGEIIRAKHIASLRKTVSDTDAKIVAHATRGLNWEAMKWGKANSRKIFDLAGITDDPVRAGIKEFKMSFGGALTDMHIYRYATPAFSCVKKIVHLAGRHIH